MRGRTSCWQQDIRASEYAAAAAAGTGFTGVIAYLFYHSVWAFIVLTPLIILYLKGWVCETEQKKQREFEEQFRDALQSLAGSLHAGYAVENALREAKKEMEMLYGKSSRISREMNIIVNQLNVNVPAEQVINGLADRTKAEDVRCLADVFAAARRSGSNLQDVLQNTISQLCGKAEVRKEIQTVLAEKRLEFTVMSLVPAAMVLYLKVSFPSFMDVLYGSLPGILFMTVSLAAYGFAFWLGRRMIDIEV